MSYTRTLLLAAALVLPSSAALADKHDHEIARQALANGEILPLKRVLERVEREHPGEPLEIELDRENGQWTYEIKLLKQDGSIHKLILDARDGRLLRSKERAPQTATNQERKR